MDNSAILKWLYDEFSKRFQHKARKENGVSLLTWDKKQGGDIVDYVE